MKDPRTRAFALVTRRLARVDKRLRETLSAQQARLQEAHQQLADQQDAVAQARRELARHESRIDALLDGRRLVRIDELLGWQDQRAGAVAQCDAQLQTLARMRDELAQIDAQAARTRHAILRNDARIDICRKHVAASEVEAQTRADDAQDEDAEEGLVARRLAARRRDVRRAGTGVVR
jgi:type III secretion system HrpB7-like protein